MKHPSQGLAILALMSSTAAAYQSHPLQQPLAGQQLGSNAEAISADGLPFSEADLEGYIEHVMDKWHAPGLAVAIINGNETWAKGFGYASLSTKSQVTPHTLFFAGSTSKSFTAAGLSLLIDNSSEYASIRWTSPISSLLREDFILSDDWATAHITIEDALCHRTGYPRHDLAIGEDTLELVRNLRYLPLSAEPRTTFQYNNMMFATAGYLISKMTGLDLGRFFHEYLWTPMGMEETFLQEADPLLKESGLELAEGYWWVNATGRYVKTPNVGKFVLADGGAGGVISNVLDYTKYLRIMMAEGGPISKAGHRELKTPRTFYDSNKNLFVGPVTYGLGWASGVLADHQVYFHTGTINTFATFMAMVPSKNYGVVVMTNSNSYVRELVTYRVLYDLLGVEDDKRYDFETQFREKDRKTQYELATCSERLYPNIPSPAIPYSVPLEDHTGQYHHVAYGDVFVTIKCNNSTSQKATEGSLDDVDGEDCHLHVSSEEKMRTQMATRLEHKTGDFWLGFWSFPETPEVIEVCIRAQFHVAASGVVSRLGLDMRMEGEDVPLVWFERVSQ